MGKPESIRWLIITFPVFYCHNWGDYTRCSNTPKNPTFLVIYKYIYIYSNSPQKYNSNFPLFKSHQIDVPYFSIYLFGCTYPIIPCISHDLPTPIGMACPCPPPQWVAAFQTRCGTSLGRREDIMGISWGEWWDKGDIRRIKGDNDGKLIRDNTWI